MTCDARINVSFVDLGPEGTLGNETTKIKQEDGRLGLIYLFICVNLRTSTDT